MMFVFIKEKSLFDLRGYRKTHYSRLPERGEHALQCAATLSQREDGDICSVARSPARIPRRRAPRELFLDRKSGKPHRRCFHSLNRSGRNIRALTLRNCQRYIGSWIVISKNVAEVFSHDRYQTTGKSAASLLGSVNRERRVRLHGSSPLEPSLGAGCPIPGSVEIDELMYESSHHIRSVDGFRYRRS